MGPNHKEHYCICLKIFTLQTTQTFSKFANLIKSTMRRHRPAVGPVQFEEYVRYVFLILLEKNMSFR